MIKFKELNKSKPYETFKEKYDEAEFHNQKNIEAVFVDARALIFTQKVHDNFEVNLEKSRQETLRYFQNITTQQVPVITGLSRAVNRVKRLHSDATAAITLLR